MKIAIIPARGGSRRIPKKNVKNFLGKPIIAYSIELAINCGLFDKVIVSTDSKEISKIAIKYGAQIPFLRPKELADDFTGTHEVIGHAIKSLEKNNYKIDYACCIYPTAPLIKKNDIIKGFKLLKKEKWDTVIAATSYSYPVHRSFTKSKSGGLKMIFPKHFKSRSQDLPIVYHDAGMFYWGKSNFWKKPNDGFNTKNSIIDIPNYRVQDIDTIDDWKKAEFIYKIINK
tara:strand:- start:1716 stop:2402 length:687 start_codon:yes stop_codon:yes gene_type:complete